MVVKFEIFVWIDTQSVKLSKIYNKKNELKVSNAGKYGLVLNFLTFGLVKVFECCNTEIDPQLQQSFKA